jgi:hypothetical protein
LIHAVHLYLASFLKTPREGFKCQFIPGLQSPKKAEN